MKKLFFLIVAVLSALTLIAQDYANLAEAGLKGPVRCVTCYHEYDYHQPYVQVWAYNRQGNITRHIEIINDDVRLTDYEYDSTGYMLLRKNDGYSRTTYTYRDSMLIEEEQMYPNAPKFNRKYTYTRNWQGNILESFLYEGGTLNTQRNYYYDASGRLEAVNRIVYQSDGGIHSNITKYIYSGDSVFRSEQAWYMEEVPTPELYKVGDEYEYDRIMKSCDRNSYFYDSHGNCIETIARGEPYLPEDTIRYTIRYYDENDGENIAEINGNTGRDASKEAYGKWRSKYKNHFQTRNDFYLSGPVHVVHQYNLLEDGEPYVQVMAFDESGYLTSMVLMVNDDIEERIYENLPKRARNEKPKADPYFAPDEYRYKPDHHGNWTERTSPDDDPMETITRQIRYYGEEPGIEPDVAEDEVENVTEE